MSIYFIGLLITLLIVRLFSTINLKIFLIRFIASTCCSIPLAVIAGLRTAVIGNDLQTYGVYCFNLAKNYNQFSPYYNYLKSTIKIEYGYDLLNYCVSRISGNINVFLFILSLFTLIPFFLGAFNMEKDYKISVVLQTIFYFSMFYGYSLNLLRQSVAITWGFLSLTLLFKKKKASFLKVCIPLIVAVSFHSTAFILIIILEVYYYFAIDRNLPLGGVKKMLFRILFFIEIIGLFVFSNGLFNSFFSKYDQYFNGSNNTLISQTNIFLTPLGFSIIPIYALMVLTFLNKNADLNNVILDKNQTSIRTTILMTWRTILILAICFSWGGLYGAMLPRIGLYFMVFESYILPFSLKYTNLNISKTMLYVIFGGYYLSIFAFFTYIGSSSIFPYQWIF